MATEASVFLVLMRILCFYSSLPGTGNYVRAIEDMICLRRIKEEVKGHAYCDG